MIDKTTFDVLLTCWGIMISTFPYSIWYFIILFLNLYLIIKMYRLVRGYSAPNRSRNFVILIGWGYILTILGLSISSMTSYNFDFILDKNSNYYIPALMGYIFMLIVVYKL